MVNTSRWPVTVDGTRLDTLAYNIRTRQGRDLEAPLSGEDIDTGMRDGNIWVPHKRRGPGRLVLDMWANGTDIDGVIPVDGDDYYKYIKNLDLLKRMFGVTHRLLDVRLQMDAAGTDIRQALSYKSALVTPEMKSGYPYTADLTIELTIPGAFLQSVADANYTSGIGLTAGDKSLTAAFGAATAPMRDLWVIVDGPGTNVRLTDRNAHYIQYNGIIANLGRWIVNTTEQTSKIGVEADVFTMNGTDVYAQTEYAGGHSPNMFGITADPLGPQVTVSGTGFGANSRLRIRGKIKFL
jgi:hypothetical protein